MKIAVLSGKGGTGKTMVAVNLTRLIPGSVYIDCDIEEPNGAIFLKPEIDECREVMVSHPEPVPTKCRGCRECVRFCKFHALAHIGEVLVFPQLCHSCGGCIRICKYGALQEKQRVIGRIEIGMSGMNRVKVGMMNPGEASGVPIIKQLLTDMDPDSVIVIDCPPGSSCAVMESIQEVDYCLLVAEPTRFGEHNLRMVYELTRLLGKPAGVLVNKAYAGGEIITEFCRKNKLPLVGEIPYDPEIAFRTSNGRLVIDDEKYRGLFQQIIVKVTENQKGGSGA